MHAWLYSALFADFHQDISWMYLVGILLMSVGFLDLRYEMTKISKIVAQVNQELERAKAKLPEPSPPTAKIFCRYCGTENKNDAVFCEKCGKKI
jgi:hypothetical protein